MDVWNIHGGTSDGNQVKSSLGMSGVFRCVQVCSGVFRCVQVCSDELRCVQMSVQVCSVEFSYVRCVQVCSGVFR